MFTKAARRTDMNENETFDFEKDYDKIRQIQPAPEQDPYKDSQYLLFEDSRDDKGESPNRTSRRQTSRTSRSRAARKKSRTNTIIAALLSLTIGAAAGLGGGYLLWGREKPYNIDLGAIEAPSWIEQDFLRKNIFSRPDVTIRQVNNIVLHYVANPGTSARANWNYFDGLADQDPQKSGASASCHFLVGLDGEILQCIPMDEMAYANAPRNSDTISIEVCHPDESGQFTDDTYDSVVKLTAWLCLELDLSPKDVIRHYDINKKSCPKYFVDNEDAWKQFRKDVEKAMKYL